MLHRQQNAALDVKPQSHLYGMTNPVLDLWAIHLKGSGKKDAIFPSTLGQNHTGLSVILHE